MDVLRQVFITPGEARLRSGWRLLLHFLLLALTLIFILGFSFVLSSLGPAFAFLENPFWVEFVAITLSVWLARRYLDRRSFVSLGLRWDAAATRDLIAGILLPGLLFLLIFLAEWGLGWLLLDAGPGQAGSANPLDIAYWGAAFLLVGWHEELLSRGYWLQNLAEGLNMPLAVFLSSAVFSLAHLANPGASLASVLGILAAGYFLAYAYLRTRQLWLPIGLHIGWNFFEGPVFGFPVSGLETASLLRHSASGPELFTGGAFGPEAGLILLPALALGAVLIYLYTRDRNSGVPAEG